MGAVGTSPAPAPVRPHAESWKHIWKKRAVSWARWLHIYLSMVSFAILFFFAATGLTLNHQEWFSGKEHTTISKGTMNTAWLGPDVAKLEIVEQLRRAQHVKGEVGDVRIENGQVAIGFKGPGYTADTVIDRATGSYELTETRMGLAAVVNDLHKGRDAGPVWALLIDASAVFMTLVSVTGLMILFFLAKRRRSGLIALGVGAAVCIVLYWTFVP